MIDEKAIALGKIWKGETGVTIWPSNVLTANAVVVNNRYGMLLSTSIQQRPPVFGKKVRSSSRTR